MDRIYCALDFSRGENMTHDTKKNDGSPNYGGLDKYMNPAVAFCGLLTYVMGTLFPDFPNF
jgi:hypothetical protein